MNFFLFILTISLFSRVGGQTCRARFNQSITGSYSLASDCQGAILNSNLLEPQRCCIPSTQSPTSAPCITANHFDVLYNTSRATFLRSVLNYGMNQAGICQNCQAKAAFLAIAATMTQNFQTDEVTGSDAQFIADDNKYGNLQEGDGSRFRQRGFFGLRGRTMYQRLQEAMPQYQSLTNPELVALTQNSIMIAAKLWTNPNLRNGSPLTPDADGSFYRFSILWHKLIGDIKQLSEAAIYYSTFLRQLECGGDLYPGQGPICQFNSTHQGICAADCIKGLEDSSTFCGCSGPKGAQCPDSPKHIRCCLDTCSQDLKMDLGFVLDASGSVGRPNHTLQLNFTKNLLEQANVGLNKTHVGIINYSTDRETLTWLNADYTLAEKLRQVDRATYYGSGTYTADALTQANTVFSYSRGRRQSEEGVTTVVFVITDGESNDQADTIRAANVLKQNDIVLVSVGVGSGPNLAELHAICTPPASENYFAISDYSALDQKLNQFTSKSCSEPAPTVSNKTIIVVIIKDKYKFIKVKIVITGNKMLIKVKLFIGKVKIFYSFTNQNPKDPADFIDYETRTSNSDPSVWTQFKSYLQQSSTKADTTENDEVTLVVERPDNNTDFAYIGIKGLEDENKFEVSFDDCDNVICTQSSASMMKLSIVLLMLAGLFVF